MMRWMWYEGWQSGWVGIFMGLFMILFWVGIIIGIIYFVKLVLKNENKYNNEKTALDILKERYAKGELSDTDYERMKQKLDEK